jgi:hypothetical protein
LPERGSRIDVAAYKPQRTSIGTTMTFECKGSASAFRRDARSMQAIHERLKVLHAKNLKIEEEEVETAAKCRDRRWVDFPQQL